MPNSFEQFIAQYPGPFITTTSKNRFALAKFKVKCSTTDAVIFETYSANSDFVEHRKASVVCDALEYARTGARSEYCESHPLKARRYIREFYQRYQGPYECSPIERVISTHFIVAKGIQWYDTVSVTSDFRTEETTLMIAEAVRAAIEAHKKAFHCGV